MNRHKIVLLPFFLHYNKKQNVSKKHYFLNCECKKNSFFELKEALIHFINCTRSTKIYYGNQDENFKIFSIED